MNKKDPISKAAMPPPPLESSLEVAPKLPPKPVREQVKVIFAYKAQNEDELTIKEGDIITVISRDNEDQGWWKGELNGRIALFPDNFVESYQPSPPPPLPRPLPADDRFRMKKPDRVGATSITTPTTTTTTMTTATSISSSSSPSSTTTTTTTTESSPLSSVPIIGRMLNFSSKISSSSNHMHSTNGPSSKVSPNTTTNDQSPSNHSEKTDHEDGGDGLSNGNREDTFNVNDPVTGSAVSPSRLVHLTAQRPKIPSNSRRPPSMHLGKAGVPTGSADLAPEESSTTTPSSPMTPPVEQPQSPSRKAGIIALKPIPKPLDHNTADRNDNSSGGTSGGSQEKKAPWLSELKKSQEKRRTGVGAGGGGESIAGDRRSGAAMINNNHHTPTVAPIKPHAPTPPKPYFASSANSNSSSSNNNNNNANGVSFKQSSVTDYSNAPTAAGTAISTDKSLPSSSSSPSSSSTINSSSENRVTDPNKSAPPTATCGEHSDDSQQQVAKMRVEMCDMRETILELRSIVFELRRDLSTALIGQKSVAEWTQQKAEMDKQLQEQQAYFENHKKNLADMVKRLINELSEEKKKIAELQIELDRVRKLTTTAV